ncbi:ABC transporter permease [Streptobacillus moniliformis]|nr:ABC transporter permease [Streptobacillus moniliformis]SQA13448.1 Oligopeptide transport system permease protein oppC [Streptobacillus moniliformis]
MMNRKIKSIIFIFSLMIFVIFEKLFNKFNYSDQDLNSIELPIFKNNHILGTDYLGRDLLARLSESIYISLLLAIIVCIICLISGLIIGSVMGYYDKFIDKIFMMIIELLLSIPSIIIIIFILLIFGNSLTLLIFAISFTRSLRLSLLVRNEVKKVKLNNYVEVAKNMGATPFYLIRRHIIPNILPIVFVRLTLMIPGIIFTESYLSFMGVGIRNPRPSLGNLISSGFSRLLISPKQFLLASLILVTITLFFGGIYENDRN